MFKFLMSASPVEANRSGRTANHPIAVIRQPIKKGIKCKILATSFLSVSGVQFCFKFFLGCSPVKTELTWGQSRSSDRCYCSFRHKHSMRAQFAACDCFPRYSRYRRAIE